MREQPNGERARKVMLIKLPSGRTIPVNYLREGDVVYAGADGRWWHELRGDGATVELFVRGETLSGRARAIEDDPDHRAAVFSRLRPTAPKFTGTLVQVDLLCAARVPDVCRFEPADETVGARRLTSRSVLKFRCSL